ncbi:ABC transporter ATP-binding protein [Streptosporangium saharense]|uniref:ABC transporter ATP-binding protein n=1 Tax=Streptosporangium saharense TaxID=1706840 RepID=UPI00343FD746
MISTRDDESGRALIRAHEIVKTYRSGDMTVPVLGGVSLEIEAGEFVTIVGPSGTGKSTLMNCLSGIDTIDSGSVIIDGLDIHALPDRRRTAHRARRMGFVFQSFNLIPVLDAVENVELPLLAAAVKPAEARERAHAMLARVGLADRARHRPGELSGGQQQRVAVARALVGNPAVIWADEPTGNLDSSTAATVVELFAELNENGQTIVIVTHDTAIATRADRTIELVDGRVATAFSAERKQP